VYNAIAYKMKKFNILTHVSKVTWY